MEARGNSRKGGNVFNPVGKITELGALFFPLLMSLLAMIIHSWCVKTDAFHDEELPKMMNSMTEYSAYLNLTNKSPVKDSSDKGLAELFRQHTK